ncbi:MAG: chlorite dismutase family protein [Actinomycetota bacterium]
MSVDTVTTSNGLGCVHLFWTAGPETSGKAVLAAIEAASDDDHQVVCAAVLGHKADLAVLALGPDLWRLRRLQTALRAAGLELVDSYVSMTEVSEYAAGVPEEMLQARLHPQLPPEGLRAFCFYPMSKRREGHANWFTLPFDDRKELMYDHGASGRKFKGRVVQLVTGSTGVDDYEWGVTLFARHLDDLKDVVYTMRFDEASALYAEFGPFTTGLVADPVDLVAELGLPD